jgi:hypothetical protein
LAQPVANDPKPISSANAKLTLALARGDFDPSGINAGEAIEERRVPIAAEGFEDLVVENIQHPATFAIQLDLVSKCLRVSGCFGLIDIVGDLRHHMLADYASIYFMSSLLIGVESDPADFCAVVTIDPSALSLTRLNYPDKAFVYVAERGITEDFH